MFAIRLKMRFASAAAARTYLPYLAAGFAVHPVGQYWAVQWERHDAERMLPVFEKHYPEHKFELVAGEDFEARRD